MKIACFDIGGTGVKSAIIGEDLELAHKVQIPTPERLSDLLDFMNQCISKEEVAAISISFPGAIDQVTGQITGLSAVPYIHGVSWYSLLADYGLPIYLENDANCVGLSQLAVDKKVQNFACVVCGTGIGGALVINRKLVRGPKSYGGEFGYMIIGGMAEPIRNWSSLASTGSLVRAVQEHPESKNQKWNGRKIFEAADQGDLVCLEAIDRMTKNMAAGLMNLYYFCDPEVIYMGGGISQNPIFIKLVQEQLDNLVETYADFPVAPRIEPCHYHQDANLFGAYIHAVQEKETT